MVVEFRLGERRALAELAAFDFMAVTSVGAIIRRTATVPVVGPEEDSYAAV
ncbi:MAG: hypothetical protein LC721_00780 [Actinobacteria bacterium]|nr:hypothetical protein [Actinomycetota bacterium]